MVTSQVLWSVGARVEIQVFRKEFHTHIYLNQAREEFYLVKKKKKIKFKLFYQILLGDFSYINLVALNGVGKERTMFREKMIARKSTLIYLDEINTFIKQLPFPL